MKQRKTFVVAVKRVKRQHDATFTVKKDDVINDDDLNWPMKVFCHLFESD